MRTSSIVTISVPPALAIQATRLAKKKHMTKSELLRAALRRYLEELQMEEAIAIADEELKQGKLKILTPGGLAELMK